MSKPWGTWLSKSIRGRDAAPGEWKGTLEKEKGISGQYCKSQWLEITGGEQLEVAMLEKEGAG